MALTATVSTRVRATYTNILDLQSGSAPIDYTFSKQLTDGSGLDKATRIFSDQRSVVAGTPDDIDLSGTLTDAFGNVLTFTKIRGLMIANKNLVAGDILNVGGAASNQFVNWVANSSDIINVGPGGVFLLFNPSLAAYAVTAGTGDILRIVAAANTITYDLVVIGE